MYRSKCAGLGKHWLLKQPIRGNGLSLMSGQFVKIGAVHCLATNNARTRHFSSASGLPSQAEIVICGGGVIGCSVAYHLSKLGKKDIVLIEQGSLSGGTTWHAVGLVAKLRATFAETMLNDYSAKLYSTIESEAGVSAGFKQCGGLLVARTKDRMVAVRRVVDKAKAFGVECELISPEEAKRKWPHMYTDDLEGALWMPEEGATTSTDVCQALAKAAIRNGVRMYEKVTLESVQTSGRTVRGVTTDRGNIHCDVFVNCGGQWAREIGQKSRPTVAVPLYSSEHFYVVTKPIKGVDPMLPIMRDPDGYIFAREWSGGFMAGGFEPVCKPCFHDGVPRNFEFQLLPEDWDHFEILMEQIIHRVPVMANAEIRQMINGPECFTPDTRYILGEAPEVQNYFVAAGMNSTGIGAAGGVGKAVAEWIVEGEPTMDLWPVDICRFGAYQNNKRYLRDRVKESLGWLYKLPYPCMERSTGRRLKCSPLYPQLEAAGASFGEKLGWERANWFAEAGEDRTNRVSFGRQNWFRNVEQEYRACHEAVGISDMSSLGIFELQSQDKIAAKDFLQLLCVSDADIPVGQTLDTAMLNNSGGYQTESTLLRTADNEYFIIVPAEFATRAGSWITSHLPQHDFVTLRSRQSSYTVLGVFGPRSQEFLQGLTPTALDTTEYAVGMCKDVHLAYASGVRMIRGTNAGHPEQSWLILVPTEHSVSLYEALMEAGQAFGARNVGSYAVECLRVEKGTPVSGYELSSLITPYEAGLESAINYRKSFKFIGMPALERLKDKPLTKRLVYAIVEQHSNANLPWGGEPIVHNDDIVGTVTKPEKSNE